MSGVCVIIIRVLNKNTGGNNADAFIRVMSHLNQIKSPESPETKHFMIKVIRSTAIDIYRKNQREWENVFYDPEDVFKNQKMSNDRGMDTVEDRHVVQRALLALDAKYREVLELKCYFGLSHREIVMLLEISEDTVAKRYERAKKIAIKMIGDVSYNHILLMFYEDLGQIVRIYGHSDLSLEELKKDC